MLIDVQIKRKITQRNPFCSHSNVTVTTNSLLQVSGYIKIYIYIYMEIIIKRKHIDICFFFLSTNVEAQPSKNTHPPLKIRSHEQLTPQHSMLILKSMSSKMDSF